MDDRAISEIVGYILIFSLIMLSATAFFTVGSSYLSETRDAERVNNAEAAFEVLASNLADHSHEDALGRSTEVRLADASLTFGDSDYLYVNVTRNDGSMEPYGVRIGEPIVYESSHGSQVTYSNGAVFREESNSSTMIHEPNLIIDDQKAVLPLTTITGSGTVSSGGSNVIQIRTEKLRSPVYTETDVDAVEMTLTTTDDRVEAWKAYFESQNAISDSCNIQATGEGGRADVTCTVETNEVYITITRLGAEFS